MQLQHKENLLVQEGTQWFAGGDQTWYEDGWRRLAGCGPTVLASILCYEKWKVKVGTHTKTELLETMNAIWELTQPSKHGIPTTAALILRMQKLAKVSGFYLQSQYLDVDKEITKRPCEQAVYTFICAGLTQDVPIAFLSLCKGKQKVIDDWHWVIITSIDQAGNITFCDEGKWQKDNVYAWLYTTTLGGGFVYFQIHT